MQIKTQNILSVAALTATLAAGISAQAGFISGKVRVDIYKNGDSGLPGVLISDLNAYSGYPGRADEVQYIDWLEFPADSGDINVPGSAAYGENYGARLTGVVVPDQTASYVFYLAADDAAEFWLSTDESPANVRLLVSEPAWNANRNYAGGLSDRPQTKSAPVALEAGKRYFFYGTVKEGGGGDHYSVAMLKDGETPVNPDSANGVVGTLPINGARLGYLAPDTRSFIWPATNKSVKAGQSVAWETWAIDGADGVEVPTYQWYKNGVAIPGATGSKYSTPFLVPTDNGAKFKVEATFASGTLNSEATLTVDSSNYQFTPGVALFERWNNKDGDTGDLDTLLATMESRPPDILGQYAEFSTPWNLGDNYGARLTTLFVPPTTGDYVFYISSDDQSYLFLSSDQTAANKKRIAAEPIWNNQHQWATLNQRDATAPENRSSTYASTEWPTGSTISLQAGQRYYMELVWREGGGGDGAGATFTLASAAVPADGAATALSGSAIGSMADASTLPPRISKGLTPTTFERGQRIELKVEAAGPGTLSYQWYKTKALIPGATTSTYVIENAGPEDVGDYYVDVTNANGTASTYGASSSEGAHDNSGRLLMTGALVIEAADFNYDGGKTKPEASDWQNYRGNAYRGLFSVHDVDYHMNDSDAADQRYRDTDGDGVSILDPNAPIKGPEPERGRGGFTITNTFGMGWSDAGEWMNYTRTFPKGNYMVYAAVAYDGRGAGAINMLLGFSDDPTKAGDQQVITPLGSFTGPATGAWSSYDLVPLKKDDGSIASVALEGEKTLRFTFNKTDGDIGWFMLYPAEGGGSGDRPTISVTRAASGGASITFTGTLQSSATVNGTYTDVTGATSPYVPPASAGDARFYRAKQ